MAWKREQVLSRHGSNRSYIHVHWFHSGAFLRVLLQAAHITGTTHKNSAMLYFPFPLSSSWMESIIFVTPSGITCM